MNITLIKTGGTISTCSENGIMIAGKSNFAEELICPAKVVSPLKKLSENFSIADIIFLGEVILKESSFADGIIVTIGTDSLTYSAAFLSFILSKIKIPVVLVSAAYPPDNIKSNAMDNILGALAFIKEKVQGVYVSYKNDGEETKIHFASRLNAARLFDGYVSSPLNKIAAVIKGSKTEIIEKAEKKNFPVNAFEIKDFKKVKIVPAFIGADYSYAADNADAVICEGYHSGTVNTEGEGSINFVKGQCYITGGIKGDKYESVLNISKAVAVDNITTAALYAKVLLLISSSLCKNEINKAIFTNFTGEFFL